MLGQTSFISEIKPVEISRKRSKIKSDNFNDNELRLYRTLIGQLSWVAKQTRPDISLDICDLSNAVNHVTVSHILCASKVLKT